MVLNYNRVHNRHFDHTKGEESPVDSLPDHGYTSLIKEGHQSPVDPFSDSFPDDVYPILPWYKPSPPPSQPFSSPRRMSFGSNPAHNSELKNEFFRQATPPPALPIDTDLNQIIWHDESPPLLMCSLKPQRSDG
jgi:hypothetical protein